MSLTTDWSSIKRKQKIFQLDESLFVSLSAFFPNRELFNEENSHYLTLCS